MTDISIPRKQCSKCKRKLPANLQYFDKKTQALSGLQSHCKECRGHSFLPPPLPPAREGYKRCLACGNEYLATAEYFHRNNQSANGLQASCKICRREVWRNWNSKHPEKIQENARLWLINNLERKRESVRRWNTNNPERQSAAARRYRNSHPEKVRARMHKRRARERNSDGEHTAAEIKAQYKRQKGKCYYCDVRVANTYHIDHVIPLARGGRNDISNLVIACPTCNLRKGDKLLHEWRSGNGKLL